jgi:hypothetical protein
MLILKRKPNNKKVLILSKANSLEAKQGMRNCFLCGHPAFKTRSPHPQADTADSWWMTITVSCLLLPPWHGTQFSLLK